MSAGLAVIGRPEKFFRGDTRWERNLSPAS